MSDARRREGKSRGRPSRARGRHDPRAPTHLAIAPLAHPDPPHTLGAPRPARPGEVLAFTRASYELDLAQEAALAKEGQAALVEVGLVALPRLPRSELAFARQVLRVTACFASVPADDIFLEAVAHAVIDAGRQTAGARPVALHVTSADSDAGNPLAARAAALGEALAERLRVAGAPIVDPTEARERGGTLVQVVLLASGGLAVGAIEARRAPSLHPGGRRRLQRRHEAPSRAALKLEEAFEWIGRSPGRGERVADLGAAPGGWTHVLSELGARVVAVDPARLRPEVAARRGVVHVQASAFAYEPDEPFDWVFCDMAWRPLEVAALLAKWARRGLASFLVANVKLPMKRRAAMLARVRAILVEAGWQGVRMRQLYHDRDEVTVAAWRT